MKISVTAKVDRPREGRATVEIDRRRGLFSVRAHRSRNVYSLPLGDVADMVALRCVLADIVRRPRVRRGDLA